LGWIKVRNSGKELATLSLVMADQIHDFLKNLPFGYFDVIVLMWLLVGLLRGRKQGMTQELLPMSYWVSTVLLAGFFNQPLAGLIREYTRGAFSVLWSGIVAYALIALSLALVFAWFKHLLGDKLTGSDVFGRCEYYLGMASGVLRFAAMLLVLLAFMHSRVITRHELDDINAQMKKNLEDIHPPRYIYGSIEQLIFSQSLSGSFVQNDLSDLLIPTVAPPERPISESPKKKLQDIIDNPMGSPKK
jgi:uncharacterized membrane protein required for colicin V production